MSDPYRDPLVDNDDDEEDFGEVAQDRDSKIQFLVNTFNLVELAVGWDDIEC